MPVSIETLVRNLTSELKRRNLTLVTAESCTGGMIAAAMTDLAGSSSVFERGFVTYSNDSKEESISVSREILEKHGAVSPETAHAMAQGALAHSRANLSVAVTGIAGPSGGSAEKPVGLVYIGWGIKADIQVARHLFSGDRASIRQQTVEAALHHLIDFLETHP